MTGGAAEGGESWEIKKKKKKGVEKSELKREQ